MSFYKKYIGSLYFNRKWYLLLCGCVVLFFTAYFFPIMYMPVLGLTGLLFLLSVIDYVLLFVVRGSVKATITTANRYSLGDNNIVSISLFNNSPYQANCKLIHELPYQFQERNFMLQATVKYNSKKAISYELRPLSRGEYIFGNLIGYIQTPIGMLQRRLTLAEPVTVKVYPSFQMLRKYALLATNEHMLPGVKKVRRLGHSMEFEKIKEYVQGDDVRTINWKATARSDKLMVNIYTDTRQQQIDCVIDKGRNMKMPFDGLTLLDHSINASLALLNVALLKQDKAGLITFSNKINDTIAADRHNNQLHRLLETLYRQQTEFKESDYEAVWNCISKKVNQRSLILFFTNFESRSSFERQLPYLRKIAKNHLVCTVFFQNTLLEQLHTNMPDSLEGIYIKTIADQFALEKRLIVKELRRHGILAILTTPQNLSIDVINKYLELKARQMV